MIERLIELIRKLNEKRGEVVKHYLDELEHWTPREGSIAAIARAGILHDLDKHITNLELEIKRLEAIKQVEGTNG